MGILVITVFFVLSCWTIGALFRRLRRQRAASRWWAAFGVVVACGVALGVWCAFFVEYQVGPRHRVGGFPIPIIFFRLEDSQ